MGFYSFANHLLEWIHHIPVPEGERMRILEWGPGLSTILMRREKPEAEIWTYEHDEFWYDEWNKQLREDPLIHLFYVPLEANYHQAPEELGVKFHLVFIDGRNRVLCLETAYHLLEEGAIVILHDAERPEYLPGKVLYDVIVERGNTAVMKRGE